MKLDRKVLYELDGGDREKVKTLEVEVEPAAHHRLRPGGGAVSTAARVPETWELTGDDARKTLLATGRGRLAKDAFVRLRAADGFSHARSLAFVTSLVFVQGLIALVGLAVALGGLRIGGVVIDAIESALPGPSSGVLTDAVNQAKKAGGNHRYLPLLLGLAGTLVTATTAMGQIERGLNRIYGIEQDRPTKVKYGRAFLLAMLGRRCSRLRLHPAGIRTGCHRSARHSARHLGRRALAARPGARHRGT